jgi:hypothetical protein
MIYSTGGEQANHYTTMIYSTGGEQANHYTTMIYSTGGEQANHYTTDVVQSISDIKTITTKENLKFYK